ncbi:MAG: membrane protein insertase YidC [Anaerolineae bacterium]|nr:membrane protein insertase YidC [Anaerolineae bacterium]
MDFLTNPFIVVMVYLYQFLGQNYVLALIVFTVVIQAVTYPLTRASLQSSKKMQELQPRLNKLKEKYPNDREKQMQAQMELYKKYGINPTAGCLPLIIQMPILFGLYGAISHTLTGTPLQVLDLHNRLSLVPSLTSLFPLHNQFLWLNLGLPDTTFVLPVLVVATTWLRTKLTTPTPADPKDPSAAMSRQMLIMMPLMTGWFSLSFASGLSIYWIVSNIVGVVQYALMGRVDLRTMSGKVVSPTVTTVDDEDDDIVLPPAKSKNSLTSGSKPATATVSRPTNSTAPKARPRMTPKKKATSKR